VQTYGLGYADLKHMVRTSLEHSFLPGASLWRDPDVFEQRVPECSKDKVTGGEPSSACAEFLRSSEKATQQWELERRFGAYEASL
jgi:adenosine deaminase